MALRMFFTLPMITRDTTPPASHALLDIRLRVRHKQELMEYSLRYRTSRVLGLCTRRLLMRRLWDVVQRRSPFSFSPLMSFLYKEKERREQNLTKLIENRGYHCTNVLSSQWCQQVIASTTQPLITCINGTNGAPASSTTQFTLPTNVTLSHSDTLLSTEVTSTVTFTTLTMLATMIQMNFQATDLASTTSLSSASLLSSSSLPTNSNSTGGTSSGGSSSSSSNHKTTTIAVSVVIPCVLIAALLGWFWYRRRAKTQLSATHQATQLAEPGPGLSNSYYGTGTTSEPSEMLGSPARVEMEGSPVMYEMAGTDPNVVTVRHEMYAGK